MAIQDLIAHRIFRSTPTSQTQIQLRDSMITTDGKAEELCRELKHTFIRKAGKVYGGFSDESGEYPLTNWVQEYLSDKISFQKFVDYAINHLQLQIDKTENVLDNTFVAFHEKLEAGDSIYFCVVDHSHGQYFDGELNLCDSLYVDTQNISLAARIKTQELTEENGHNYLSILKWRGEKELSEAFVDFIGLANKVDIAAETSQFLDIVSAYTNDLPEDVAKETKTAVVDYCLEQDKSGSPIAVAGICKQISVESKPEFSEFMTTYQPSAKKELIPDKAQLRNYVRISGRNEQMSMSFASAALGDSIVYDSDTDSITIKNIPSSLKSKLVKHLQKS